MESGFASWYAQYDFVVAGFVAGLFAALACGLGALPLAWPGLKLEERVGLGYAFAGGLMFSASVYNLLMPAFTFGSDGPPTLGAVLKTLLGIELDLSPPPGHPGADPAAPGVEDEDAAGPVAAGVEDEEATGSNSSMRHGPSPDIG